MPAVARWLCRLTALLRNFYDGYVACQLDIWIGVRPDWQALRGG